jgi:hypothetical protein
MGMHEHIHEMTNLSTKLKSLEMNVNKIFLVQIILIEFLAFLVWDILIHYTLLPISEM